MTWVEELWQDGIKPENSPRIDFSHVESEALEQCNTWGFTKLEVNLEEISECSRLSEFGCQQWQKEQTYQCVQRKVSPIQPEVAKKTEVGTIFIHFANGTETEVEYDEINEDICFEKFYSLLTRSFPEITVRRFECRSKSGTLWATDQERIEAFMRKICARYLMEDFDGLSFLARGIWLSACRENNLI